MAGGTLIIRGATENEQVTTLDGQVRELPAEAMVIDDADGPTSIAGIMGGERSEVQPDTTRVLMEVANWDGVAIHATSQKLTLRSEASGRNEKGLSPEQCVEAQAVAQRLMLELTGATLVPGFIDIGGNGPAPRTIRLRDARVTHLLGMSIALTEQVRVLEALGFEVVRVPDGLDVTVPHFRRNDVTREADLVEEVARLTALEDLPATLPRLRPGARLTPAQQVRRRAEDVLVGRGVFEIAGWSLVAPELLDKLRLPADAPMRDTVNLVNPMSAEQSILRPTLLGSLLDVARHNLARGRDRVALFDSGTVYRNDPARTDGLVDEHHGLGCLLAGPIAPTGWDSPAPPPAGFFAVKGLVAAVLDTLRVPWEVQASDAWPFLHPGRSALVRSGERRLGFVGELHPLVAREWDLPSAAAFALDLGVVAELAIEVPEFADLTSFPPVRQDLSLLIGERTAAEVIAGVRQAGGRLLRSVTLFDRFARDEQVSIALHLEFAAPDRTLTDDEVDGLRTKILDALAQQGVVRVPDDLPTVLVAGASGFAGALAARLLHRHPGFELTAITSRSDAGRRLDDLYPHHRVPLVLDALNLDEAGPVDAAIVGYPHAASAPVVAQMRERGIRVVDLSADFRLRDTATYTQWYGNEHPAPQLIPDAVYGLPERNRDAISRADLVACPGCFPTAAILALGPLADAGLLDDVVIDAKTGVSGAGREATQTTHFVSVDENVAAYKVGAHRHTPEMEQELGVPVTFVPHLVPVDQGEQLSCYLTLRDGADAARARELLEAAYAGEPFVELVERPPGMRDVRETNVCRISVHDAGRKVVVLAAIDNLWKGTASQAVQCLNLMFGLDETAGIAA